MEQPFIVKPGDNVSLNGVGDSCNFERTPEYIGSYRKKGETKKPLKKLQKQMFKLQELLYAENQHALLGYPARHGYMRKGWYYPEGDGWHQRAGLQRGQFQSAFSG